MSTIKNGQISLYRHFNEIIKEPETSFQSPALSQKHIRNVFHTTYQYLTKFHSDRTQDSKEIKQKCNFHYVAMLMMTSQILKSVYFTKIQKSRYLGNETLFLFQIKKFINCSSRATLWQKIVLQRRQPLNCPKQCIFCKFVLTSARNLIRLFQKIVFFLWESEILTVHKILKNQISRKVLTHTKFNKIYQL